MKRSHKKIISVLMLASFLFSSSVWAGPKAGIEMVPKRETPAFLELEIPGNLAKVEEIFEAPPKVDPELVLHVQDSHGNYESQMKIKDLLAYLYKQYGFQLLFVEGAAERLNPEFLRLFPDHERNVALADYLAREGELTGVEFYLIDGPSNLEAIGIEQPELYRANYEAFKKVHARTDETDEFLRLFDQKLETLSSKSFPADTRRLLSEWKKFQKGQRDFLPYVKKLGEDAKRYLNTDLQSLFAQAEWPQVTRLLVLQSMETDLDRQAALKDKARLLEFLKLAHVSDKLIKAVEGLEERHIRMSRLEPADVRLENLPRYLLERLVEEAGPKGFVFHEYPDFSLYAGFLILQSELDSKYLFAEINLLFEKILDAAAKTSDEKALLALYEDADLLRNLFHLELSRKDWQRGLKKREDIQPQAMAARLEKCFKRQADAGTEDMGQLAGMAKQPGLIQTFDTAYEFYNYARQRESVFFHTVRKEMSGRTQDKSTLITGGFHTEGVMDMLRGAEINYGILTPRLSEQVDHKSYVSTMLQNRPTVFDLATLSQTAMIQRAAVRTSLGLSVGPEVLMVLNAYLHVLATGQPGQPNFLDARAAAARFNQSLYAQDRKSELRLAPDKKAYQVYVNGQHALNAKGNPVEIPVGRRDRFDVLEPLSRKVVVPPSAGAVPVVRPPVIPAAPARLAEEPVVEAVKPFAPWLDRARQLFGPDAPRLGQQLDQVDRLLPGNPQATVFMLAGKIFRPDVPAESAAAILEALAKLNPRQAVTGSEELFGIPMLAPTQEPGTLIVVSNRLPSVSEIRMAGLELNSPNQRIRWIVELPGGGKVPAELVELAKKETPHAKGRLNISVVAPGALDRAIRTAILEESRKLRGQIAAAGLDLSISDLQMNHTVVMFDDGVQGFSFEKGGDALPAKVVRSQIDRNNTAGHIARILVGSKYSTLLLSEAELIRELGRVIDFKLIPPTINENTIQGLAAMLWQVQRFREYLEQSA